MQTITDSEVAALRKANAAMEKALMNCSGFLSKIIQNGVEGEIDGQHVNVVASDIADEIDAVQKQEHVVKHVCTDINEQARSIVLGYVLEHLDKSDETPSFETYIVWSCHILGNHKWLISTTLADGMYYEVTFNNAKKEFYLDAYKKFENRCIPV